MKFVVNKKDESVRVQMILTKSIVDMADREAQSKGISRSEYIRECIKFAEKNK